MSDYGDSFNSSDTSTTSTTSTSCVSSPKEVRTDSVLRPSSVAPPPIPVPVHMTREATTGCPPQSPSVEYVSADSAVSPQVEAAAEAHHIPVVEGVHEIEVVRSQFDPRADLSITEKHHTLSSLVEFGRDSEGSLRYSGSVPEGPAKAGEHCNDTVIAVEEEVVPLYAVSAALEPDVASSHAGSSIFSTLSQHLTRAQVRPKKSKHAALLLPENMATVAENVMVGLPSRDHVQSKSGLVTLVATETEAATVVEKVLPLPEASAIQSAPQITFALPPLGSLLPPERQPPHSGEDNLLTGVPAPLPSREPRQDPKIVELRETSEAVERLVRAFALLRGHVGPPASPNHTGAADASYATKDVAQLSNLRRQQRAVGNTATVHVHQSRIPRAASRKLRPRGSKSDDMDSGEKDRRVAVAMNEAVVEDAIMCLVMELLQRDAKQPFEDFGAVRKAIQPSFEVVPMGEFRTPNTASLGRQQRKARAVTRSRGTVAPLCVFDGGMRAFAPDDAEASESLYHSVIQALQKYVLSHVDTSSHHGGHKLPPTTPHFAWALQLDLLSICMQVLETRLIGKCGVAKDGAPVWIQYEGSPEAEPLARNAVHCLPFEALDARLRSKPIFRMEYWVTADKMWTVVEALAASLRESIVVRADGYCVFSKGEEMCMMDPATLFPTRVPLFSLLPSDISGVRPDDAPSTQQTSVECEEKRHVAGDEPHANYFEVEPATLESLAHAVSTATTEILESDSSRAAGRNYRQSYQDATRAVAGAVCELLNDAGIRAAVQRRAKANMTELAQRREANSRLSREERESSIIATAEAEAEQVVQRILQEMRLQKSREA